MRIVTPLVLLALGACVGPGREQKVDPHARSAAAQARPAPEAPVSPPEGRREGLELRLSDADPSATVDGAAPADARALSDQETAGLLARLPELVVDVDDTQPFAVRDATRPPPRTGGTVQTPFPPPGGADAPDASSGAPEVVRFAPEGEVPVAPHLSVTFSEPMVAVTSQDAAAERVPVTLSPQPPGEWRWIGTKTVLFEPDGRFPMATDYRVEVPAGAVSAAGVAIAEPASWTFATPPPTVEWTHPSGGPHGLLPLVALRFDQRVDPEAIAPFVTLRGPGGEVPLRPATPDEIAADPVLGSQQAQVVPGRLVVFMPVAPLSPGRTYQVGVGAGAPSAEGPRRTTAPQASTFSTFDPLALERSFCEDQRPCPPGAPMRFEWNNPIDPGTFDADALRIEPALDDARAVVSHRAVTIYGDTRPDTTYRVTFPAALTDTFGQQLGRDEQARAAFGPPPPRLTGADGHLVLDPVGPRAYSVFSSGYDALRVRVRQVEVGDWPDAVRWSSQRRYDGRSDVPAPGDLVSEQVIDVDGVGLVETVVDLSPWLPEGRGHVVVEVEPARIPEERHYVPRLTTWVQSTDIGLTALVDARELVGWATSLRDGAPLDDVSLSLLGRDGAETTDAGGLARLGLYPDHDGPHALVARRGSDVALLPDGGWWADRGSWVAREPSEGLRWYVFDDRQMYRPGETVRVKGWLRRFDPSPGGGLRGYGGPGGLEWKARDARGGLIGEGRVDIDETGGFDLSVALPDTPNLGYARVELAPAGGEGSYVHGFQIQEFRRPEFEVTATVDPGPYVVGDHAVVTASADYYAGGGLASAPVSWRVTSTPTSYVPAGWRDFRFGAWSPPWFRGGRSWPGGGPQRVESLDGITDPRGDHHLRMDFVSVDPPRPSRVHAEATVVDVNRQRWTAGQDVVVHPSSLYVGVRTDRGFYPRGADIGVEAVVVDIDGEARAEVPVDVRLDRVRWEPDATGAWREVTEEAGRCAVTSATEPVDCRFSPEHGGRHRLVARVADDAGRPNETVVPVWIAGGELPPSRDVTEQEVTLVPDRETYQPGDVAEVLVQAPFSPAEGLLTLRRNGVIATERFTVTGESHTLRIPITDDHVPNLHVAVELVGSAERTDDAGEPLPDAPPRVAFAGGELALDVPPLARTLDVEITPRASAVGPGDDTVLDLVVSDAEGRPVDAEVAVVVVDEAVLALSGYQLPDPLEVFYAHQGGGVREAHSRTLVKLAVPEAVAQEGGAMDADSFGAVGRGKRSIRLESAVGGPPPPPSPAPRALADEAAPAEAPVSLRTDLRALALFAPRVRTEGGRAQVPLTLPDSLTRYRIMAVAVEGDTRFGTGESGITARKPLMLRPSPPRFLNFGDRAEVPLVVQNQTDAPLEVRLALRAGNAHVLPSIDADLTGDAASAGRAFTVPANDRREVRVPVASDAAGTARFQAIVASGDHTDAAAFELPVFTPATAEAFATYGTLDSGHVVQPVEAPADAWPQFGALEVTTSSTELQALTDALVYVTTYPYACTEQIGSRVLSVTALRDVLGAFEAEQLPEPEVLEASVAEEIARIGRRQHPNGGWGFWGTTEPEPFVTVHVTHALIRARAAGYEVPDAVLDRALGYLRRVERHIPRWYSERARRSILSYALHVRHRAGDTDVRGARTLMADPSTLSLEAQAWLLPVLHAGGRTADVDAAVRRFEQQAVETAGAAAFQVGYTDRADYVLLHTSRRTDAIVLDALLEVRPDHDLGPKLVRGLLGHRTAGRWANTQENVFVLMALHRYFVTHEAVTPDFVARIWLGDRFAGEHVYEGRTTERQHVEVPMGVLADPGGSKDLVVAKEGEGRMYYRVGLRYAPRSLDLDAADRGFAVERTYEAVDDPSDVTRDDDGTWRIRAGARVRSRVRMVAPARRTHVMLVDPLPAGLEPLNPELATTGTVPSDPSAARSGWWWGPWYQHQNLRDDRVEAFTSLLPDGVYTYSYVATATTPGDFVVPPARVEEMYHPETFGRGATDRVVVE